MGAHAPIAREDRSPGPARRRGPAAGVSAVRTLGTGPYPAFSAPLPSTRPHPLRTGTPSRLASSQTAEGTSASGSTQDCLPPDPGRAAQHADTNRLGPTRCCLRLKRSRAAARQRLVVLPRSGARLTAMIVRHELSLPDNPNGPGDEQRLSPAGVRNAAMHSRSAPRRRVNRERTADGGDAVAHVRDPRAGLRFGRVKPRA